MPASQENLQPSSKWGCGRSSECILAWHAPVLRQCAPLGSWSSPLEPLWGKWTKRSPIKDMNLQLFSYGYCMAYLLNTGSETRIWKIRIFERLGMSNTNPFPILCSLHSRYSSCQKYHIKSWWIILNNWDVSGKTLLFQCYEEYKWNFSLLCCIGNAAEVCGDI